MGMRVTSHRKNIADATGMVWIVSFIIQDIFKDNPLVVEKSKMFSNTHVVIFANNL